MVSQAQEANIFRTVDAIIGGSGQTSLNLIHNLTINGRSASYIIGMVTRQLRQLTLVHSLLETGENQAKIQTLLGISSNYAVQKTIEQAIKYSSEDIKRKYELLLQCDLNIKIGKLNPDQALETLVFDLSAPS